MKCILHQKVFKGCINFWTALVFFFSITSKKNASQNALELLAKLSMFPMISAGIKESHYNMINTAQQQLQKDLMTVNVFYSLTALEVNVPKIAKICNHTYITSYVVTYIVILHVQLTRNKLSVLCTFKSFWFS